MNPLRCAWLGFALPSAALVVLLWLPFGFGLHGLIEEWGVLDVFTQVGPVLFVKAHSLLEMHRLRPLTVVPHALGFMLDRDSFDGWHWALIAALILKGAAASWLVAAATRSPRWGAFFGLLVLLYPADTMQLSFRSQHINLSLAMLLLGAALLVRAQDLRSGWPRWVHLLAGASCLLAAEMMYEVALMLVMLPLFVLWCREGTRSTVVDVRRNPMPTLAWIAAALAYVLFVLYASASGGDAYQETLTDRHSPFKLLYHALPRLYDTGFARALVGGWLDACGMAIREFRSYWYLLGVGFVCSACIVLFPRGAQPAPTGESAATTAGDIHRQLRLTVSGLLLLMVGYLPYLFSPAHVLISQRTFLFSTFGAALVILAVVMRLARLSRALACLCAAFLMTVGAAAQLYQFQHYVNISEMQRKVLRAIVENFDGETPDGKRLLILDHSNQLSHTWLLREYLGSALAYLYGKPMALPLICLMPDGNWEMLDAALRAGRCVEEAQNWKFVAAPTLQNVAIPPIHDIVQLKSQIIQLVIHQDGSITPDKALNAYRQRLESADTPVARRYRNILKPPSTWVHLNLFKPAQAPGRWRTDFGDWWSLEQPIRGSGWRDADWTREGYLHHDAAAWKSQEHSSLLFDISPIGKRYRLAGAFSLFQSTSSKESMRVHVNNVTLPLTWSSAGNFSARIPEEALRQGTNTIEFDSSVDNSFYDLSARLSAIEISPED